MASESLHIRNPDDPKEVLEALKKEGITSLDDLVKKGIEHQKSGSPVVRLGCFSHPSNIVFMWGGMR